MRHQECLVCLPDSCKHTTRRGRVKEEAPRIGRYLLTKSRFRPVRILSTLDGGALKLVITESTVKVHMKAILRKLRLQNRTQAAIWARTHLGELLENARA